jgi:hypothetical protein
MERRRER